MLSYITISTLNPHPQHVLYWETMWYSQPDSPTLCSYLFLQLCDLGKCFNFFEPYSSHQ